MEKAGKRLYKEHGACTSVLPYRFGSKMILRWRPKNRMARSNTAGFWMSRTVVSLSCSVAVD